MFINITKESIGSLRVSFLQGTYLFCFIDLCKILSLPNKKSTVNKLDKSGINFDTDESGERLMVISLGNVNQMFKISKAPNIQEICEWFVNSVFPVTQKNVEYSVASLKEEAMAMRFLKEYGDLQMENIQLKKKLKRSEPYLSSMTELFGNKKAISLNQYFEQIFERNIPRSTFFQILRNKGILDENNHITQEYQDSMHFKKVKSEVVVGGVRTISEIVFVFKSGINLIERIIDSYEGDKKDVQQS